MAGWTIEVDTGAGFSSRTFVDFGFDTQANQMGTFHATILPGSTEPSEGNEVKVWWDKGGGQERLWFRGVITSKRKDDLTQFILISGYDDAWYVYQSSLGNLRGWSATTPYAILTTATGGLATTTGLRFNAQNNAVFAYATTAPNAIKAGGADEGNPLTFRAQGGNLLLAIARLCEQATHGGGPTYGLEWFMDRSGADAKQLNVVTRRERSIGHTAENYRVGSDDPTTVPAAKALFPARGQGLRETNRDNDYDRIKVIGEGSGTSRVDSGWVGVGSRELVYSDKSISDPTTATNLANRLLNALNQGSTPRFEGYTVHHNLTTYLGDDVNVIPLAGGAATTYRCFGIGYEFKRQSFRLEIGRSRRFLSSYLRDVARSLDSLELHTQVTDLTPVTLFQALSDVQSIVIGGPTLVPATSRVLIASITPPADWGKAMAYLLEYSLAATVAPGGTVAAHAHDMANHTHTGPSHTHDMANHTHDYDKTTGVTISSENSGIAGADPHSHTATPTHTATASGVPSTNTTGAGGTGATSVPSTNTTGTTAPAFTVQGPFNLEVLFTKAGSTDRRIAAWTLPVLSTNGPVKGSNTYPMGWASDDLLSYTPDAIEVYLDNLGAVDVTVEDDGANMGFIFRIPPYRLNA